jgi:hypothetical protein
MPAAIAAAVVRAMSLVGKVAKGDFNKHGGYKFASIDAFLDATSAACAEAGLFAYPVETSSEKETVQSKEGPKTYLKVTYQFMLVHESGASWQHPNDSRPVILPFNGTQTHGSAQSYALKQFWRGLLQIPTGDGDDPDHKEKFEYQTERVEARTTAVRAAQKLRTGNTLGFDFGAGIESVEISQLAKRVSDDVFPPDREDFARTNAPSLEALHKKDRNVWLTVKRILEFRGTGAPGGEIRP